MNYKILLSTILYLLFLSCSQKNNESNQIQSKNTTPLYLLANKATVNKDSIDIINRKEFEEFCNKIPNLPIPFKFHKDILPKGQDDILDQIRGTKFDYGRGVPSGKIVKDNFVAIIYNQAVSNTQYVLETYTKNGIKLDNIEVYLFLGNDMVDPPYELIEECESFIKRDLNIFFKYKALLVKNDKSNKHLKDSVLKDLKDIHYRINENGKIIEIKRK